ncbi:cytoplasmic protein [Devosia geojensis]|uniref:Cytoplasmic protein n=1 Tax=Devosia geojensis TaxID=443610 RepID=A0A0F5FD92_9HYPH|nr:crosslink repair DNA glycosylase YcaQ family protein [Devosia geojensis]KKB06821.1 cytoplasmic protein [Devosia geojensis]
MSRKPSLVSHPLSVARARRLWLGAQRLDSAEPFGAGPQAVPAAVRHLGYVQIDTINVIERSHHHILFTRIPSYERAHMRQAQSVDKSVFEYWTHALAYIPSEDLRFFLPAMKRYKTESHPWYANVDPKDVRRLVRRIRDEGPLSIRDIDDDELVEKDHPWASRKPSKRALQLAFYTGDLTISARSGMVKTYELMDRHFGWTKRPSPATERQGIQYLLDRALTAQGIVSLDSICYLHTNVRTPVKGLIDARVKRKQLVPVHIEGAEKAQHWVAPELLDVATPEPPHLVHILSPFDPLIIQRKRLKHFFGYDHIFEAYVPAAKRVLGYFALPVLVGDRIVAAIDLKADRQAGKLIVQKWTWVEEAGVQEKVAIDEALTRFERFQFGG